MRQTLILLQDPRAAKALAQSLLTPPTAARPPQTVPLLRRVLNTLQSLYAKPSTLTDDLAKTLDLPAAKVLASLSAQVTQARAQIEASTLINSLPSPERSESSVARQSSKALATEDRAKEEHTHRISRPFCPSGPFCPSSPSTSPRTNPLQSLTTHQTLTHPPRPAPHD